MSRLGSLLTALWVSSVAAQSGFLTGIKDATTKEVQGVLDPVGQGISFIGGSLCNEVKQIAGVVYDKTDQEPDMSKLTLVYQTRAKIVTYNLTLAASEIPKSLWFNNTDVLKIYFHGFTDNPMKNSFQTISEAFASQGITNILALDASSLIAFFYLRATYLVEYIGEKVGAVLAALVKRSGLKPENIHLIGHSLGAHMAGFAGKKFLELTGSRLGVVTGLDPAGPCFAMLDDISMRLSQHDARYVEALHTDAGVLGLYDVLAHVDYYANGGKEQPGCLLQTCSHSRAWELYAESVRRRLAFISVKCRDYEEFRKGGCDYKDTSVMGFWSPKTSSACGTYYFQTNDKEPFGRGELGVTYENNDGIAKNVKNFLSDLG